MDGYIRFHGGPLHNRHLSIRDWSRDIDAPVPEKRKWYTIKDTPPVIHFKVVVYRCRAIKYGNTVFYEYHLSDAAPCGKVNEPLPQEKCDRFAFHMTPAVTATGRLVLISPAASQLRETIGRIRRQLEDSP